MAINVSVLNTGKLTFEGVKIKGALGGSGDGLGSDTIELVPDVDLYATDQYLVIDPTGPDHIHIRAGGPQDDSDATLILGGEKSNITIDDQADAHVSILSRTADNSTSHVWQFNNDGSTRFPLLDVSLLVGGTTSAETLEFSNNTKKSVITGPTPASGIAASSLILQGRDHTGAAGADVNIWAGRSNIVAGNINIAAGTTSSGIGGTPGAVSIKGGGNAGGTGGDVTLTAGTGAGSVASLYGKIAIASGYNTWNFNNNGTIKFPYLDSDLHTTGNTNAETLKFSNNTKPSVIIGPTPATSTAANPLIIQGHKQTGAAGGDVYLWGGDSNTAGGNVEILAGDNDGTSGTAGIVTIKGGDGPGVSGSGGDVVITAGNGPTPGEVTISSNNYYWIFNSVGSTNFPTITTDLLGIGSTSVEALMFGDNTKQSVITGPTPNASTNVKAIIIQGQSQADAAGGDVCIYGGKSNRDAGDINITAGTSNGATYAAGTVTLQAGSNESGTGGNVNILGGTGSSGANGGEVNITSNSNTWTFNNDGNITIPTSKDIREPGGSTAISGGNRVKACLPTVGVPAIVVDTSNIYLVDTRNVASTIILPDSKEIPIGYEFTVTDTYGSAASKNITITAIVGDLIISAPSGIAIDTNYGLLTFKNVGGKWLILYGR